MIGKLNAPSRLFDQVYNAILEGIADGSLAAGQRVTQDGLADQLGVSRHPVAQALTLLEKQGFLRPSGRQGLKVAPLDSGFLRDLFEIRGALDAVAARHAAANLDTESRERGGKLLRKVTALAEDEKAEGFHEALATLYRFFHEVSGNPMLKDLCDPYWTALTTLSRPADGPETRNTLAEISDRLWTAMIEGDLDEAEHLARHNARLTAKDLVEARGGE